MRFSIVIPTYNGEYFIEQTLLSALEQHRPFDEIIVSDDNSTDKTLEICEKYKDRIKIYKNENGPSGFTNGWNNAVAKATGDYIAILHQDDLLDKSFLLEMEKVINDNPDVLHLFSTCNYINRKNELIGFSYLEFNKIRRYSGLEYVKAYQKLGNPHIHRCPGVITHRRIFEKMQYNPAAGHIADDDFFYRVGQYTDIVGILKPLASYRIHNQSETGKLSDVNLVKRLIDAYAFQIIQWKDCDFLDVEAYGFFVEKWRKYKRRYLGYGIKHVNIRVVVYALRYRYFK